VFRRAHCLCPVALGHAQNVAQRYATVLKHAPGWLLSGVASHPEALLSRSDRNEARTTGVGELIVFGATGFTARWSGSGWPAQVEWNGAGRKFVPKDCAALHDEFDVFHRVDVF